MQPRFLAILIAAAVYIPTLLLLDMRGVVPQLALGLATLAFLVLITRNADVDKREVIVAILVATTGEIVLSLGWGLYTYRNALIPLYVPFGLGIFYALAVVSARQPTLQRHAHKIVQGVLGGGTI